MGSIPGLKQKVQTPFLAPCRSETWLVLHAGARQKELELLRTEGRQQLIAPGSDQLPHHYIPTRHHEQPQDLLETFTDSPEACSLLACC